MEFWVLNILFDTSIERILIFDDEKEARESGYYFADRGAMVTVWELTAMCLER